MWWGTIGIAENGTSDGNAHLNYLGSLQSTRRTIMCPVPFSCFTGLIEHPPKKIKFTKKKKSNIF